MVSDDFKEAYGRILAREPDFYAAGLILTNEKIGEALWVSNNWRNDPIVKAARSDERRAIKEEKDSEFSKEEFARELLEVFRNPLVDGKDRIAAAKLVADVKGWIEKPQTTVNNNLTVSPKVINVPQFASIEDYEAAASRQQSELLNVATSRH